jgi:hypothetical protein
MDWGVNWRRHFWIDVIRRAQKLAFLEFLDALDLDCRAREEFEKHVVQSLYVRSGFALFVGAARWE